MSVLCANVPRFGCAVVGVHHKYGLVVANDTAESAAQRFALLLLIVLILLRYVLTVQTSLSVIYCFVSSTVQTVQYIYHFAVQINTQVVEAGTQAERVKAGQRGTQIWPLLYFALSCRSRPNSSRCNPDCIVFRGTLLSLNCQLPVLLLTGNSQNTVYSTHTGYHTNLAIS